MTSINAKLIGWISAGLADQRQVAKRLIAKFSVCWMAPDQTSIKSCLTALSGLVILVVLIFSPAAASKSTEVAIKSPQIAVERDIRLTDIFTGLPVYKDRILGKAPIFGEKITLTQVDLEQIATEFELQIEYLSPNDQIIITAPIRQVDYRREIEPALTHTLRRSIGKFDQLQVQLPQQPAIILPRDRSTPVAVSITDVNEKLQKFQATVFFAADEYGPAVDMRLQGSFIGKIYVPILTRSLSANQVVQQQDVQLALVEANKVQNRTLLTLDSIVGKATRRSLSQATMVRVADLKPAILIRRGDIVNVAYNSANISISAVMQALDSAEKGQVIEFRNLATRKKVMAMVAGTGQAYVISDPHPDK